MKNRIIRTGWMMAFALIAAGSDATADPSHGSFTAEQSDPHGPKVQIALDGIRAAAAAGDVAGLLAWFDPDATFSFGTETGHDAFLELWQDDGDDTFGRFLAAFDAAVVPGGIRLEKDAMRFPYHTRIVAENVDPYFVMHVAPGELRARPAQDAARVDIIPYASVHCVDPLCLTDEAGDWLTVQLADGSRVYAPPDALRSVVSEYRLILEESEAGYRVTIFVAGD
ncbi:hypothetical protein ACEWPM_016850 [Roseovarius sp. S4756]|uniref:hypothetical protein n=1 Tax=Roseovarius maritimus TaxID=3342637 RepID=UPI00372899DF